MKIRERKYEKRKRRGEKESVNERRKKEIKRGERREE